MGEPMKKNTLFVMVTALLLLGGLIASTSYIVLLNQKDSKLFYVGVTYCGSSVEEAKELVDKVKDCTNLFVLQSGPLRDDVAAMEEIGDYAVALNLNYAVSSSASDSVGLDKQVLSKWLIEAKERWGDQFIGIYYGDESGGDMIDGEWFPLEKIVNEYGNILKSITKLGSSIIVRVMDRPDGYIISSSTNTTYMYDDEIFFVTAGNDLRGHYTEYINYYPNGTIILEEYIDGWHNFYTSENITKYTGSILSYEALLKQKPIQNYNAAANAFVDRHKESLEAINKEQLSEKDILVFTADYGLYWWNYKGGYDLVLAELAWNHSDIQQIALVRGAANLQNKQWGTILTWKYTQAPYLTNGEEMFEQMKASYEAGADYVLIFNYSEDIENPNTLQEEHYQALERFWNEIVQNSERSHGDIKAEAALVLPKNYGWGMRNSNDNIWGLWPADDNSQEIWSQIQTKIEQYGLKLDIVFEDSDFFVEGKYVHTHYWDQRTPTIIIALAILSIFSIITLSIIIYKLVSKKRTCLTH
jgi:hypothetical protein